jgi:hypothetical protein
VAKRRRGEREGDLKDGDFVIPLGSDGNVPAPTMELETADLKEMGITGEAYAKPNLVIQTGDGRVLELQPGWSQGGQSPIAADAPSIIVDDALGAAPVQHARIQPRQPLSRTRTEPSHGRGGAWLVVLVYVLSATALGLAIYERFVAV